MIIEKDPGPFRFSTVSGEDITFDTAVILFRSRTSRSGTYILRFPAPFDRLEIASGERVGPAKLGRIKQAVAFFQHAASAAKDS